MLMIFLDALVLMALIKGINDDEVNLVTAMIIGVVAAVGTSVLAFALVSAMGLTGIFLAGIIAAGALGIAVSAMYGVEIKRSMMIGLIFMVFHIGSRLGLHFAFSG